MLRALMASASGCITLSLAFHATLLWGAARPKPPAEHHVAVDLVTSAITLGLESERPGPNERGADAAGPAVSDSAEGSTDAAPAARPRPAPESHPVRRAEERPPRPSPSRAPEKTVAPEPKPVAEETRPAPAASSSAPAPAATPALPSEPLASSHAGSDVLPALVSGQPGGSSGNGSSGNGSSGNGGAQGEPGVSSARDGNGEATRRAALLDYARRVRSRIAEHREYPHAARRARLHGTVCLRIEVAASGRLLDAQPTCGNSLAPLARAALAAVAKASPFPALPAALGQRLTLDVPVIFELED